MTQKEAVLKKHPEAENEECYGGMRYCPHTYSDILTIPLDLCNANTANSELCETCWNQEMKLPTPAEKPMAQVNAFMNRDAQVAQAENAVEHPTHYCQGSIECIDALNAMVEGWDDPVAAVLAWQTVKYIWRHPFKGKPLEDIRKAQFYLARMEERYLESEAEKK
mgnify:CR=1 FL=1